MNILSKSFKTMNYIFGNEQLHFPVLHWSELMLAAPGPSAVFQEVTMMSMRCICALSYGGDGITKTK